jgi:beta-aspartyl-peptidase (threonine type)
MLLLKKTMNSMRKIAIAIHVGAGPDKEFIRQHVVEYENGLRAALQEAYSILKRDGSALNAAEAAVKSLEDNPLFNAGRGAALNHSGEVEMDAAMMCGTRLKAGAVALLRQVRNPISLARNIMEHTNHVLVAGQNAIEFARSMEMVLEPDAYFITEHQVDEYLIARKKETPADLLMKPKAGTVGAVALDVGGGLAAATSTGGTVNCLPGRIGDSALIGCGCYADNRTCAAAATGDGEWLMTRAIAHSLSSLMEHTDQSLKEASEYLIHTKNKDVKGDLGIISVNTKGEIAVSFNSKIMPHGWINSDGDWHVQVY